MLQIGLVTVIASRDAVTTQVYCVWVPSRSAMIVGSAVETMVALTIATNSADISPTRTSTISRWVISARRAFGGRVAPVRHGGRTAGLRDAVAWSSVYETLVVINN